MINPVRNSFARRNLFISNGVNLRVICALIIFINPVRNLALCHDKSDISNGVNIPLNIYANNKDMKIRLNPAHFKEINLNTLLEKRYSCRDFQDKSLNLDDIATMLWATCGKKQDAITQATRTIPSAGATYPLELYLVVGRNSVDKLKAGVYHYLIEEHSLELITEGDMREELSRACLGQDFIQEAPVSLVITAKFPRTTNHYGTRGQRYVYMEAGHACQNTYLAVTNLGLATVEVGAFVDDSVKQALNLDKDCVPLSVMPIGYPRKSPGG